MSDEMPPPPPPTTPPPPPPADPVPGASGGYSIGEAFNYGWTKFQANLGPIILATLAIVVVAAVIQAISFGITSGLGSQITTEIDPDTGTIRTSNGGLFGAGLFVSLLFGILTWLVSLVIGVGIVRAALDLTHGRPIELATMFRVDNLGQVVLAGLIIAVATGIGSMLCLIPGLVVAFFTQYTLFFLVDRNLPAIEAIKASIGFVNKNLGTLVGFYLAALVAVVIGFALCFVGALVAIPVVVIATAYTYRRLQGEPVAA